MAEQQNLQPNLENALVRIRPLAEQDIESLYQVAKDPLIWEQHPVQKRHERTEFEKFFRDSMASKGALLITDKKSGEVIGSSRFKKLESVDTAVEIGWTFLARAYWGGKYNIAVKTLMIDHAFNHYEDVIFYVTNSNIRSQKAVQKIGGIETTESKFQSATLTNDITYRIRKDNWKLNWSGANW